jgi:hypothetical protein
MTNIDPNLLAMLDEEREFMSSTGRRQTARVKIPKGHSWLMRWLPVQLGPRKSFFARIAFHWINQRPILCVRNTGVDFGGNPESECLVCETSDKLNNHGSKKVQDIGYKARAVPQWLTYTLVFSKDDGDSDIQEIKGEERWKPQEYWLHKAVFEDIYSCYKKRPSMLDLEKGCDFWVTNTKRGAKLDRQDPSPICRLEKLQAIEEKIFSQIKFQSPGIPEEDAINDVVDKLNELAFSRRGSDDDDRGDRRASRSRGDDTDRKSGDEYYRGESRSSSREEDGDDDSAEDRRETRRSPRADSDDSEDELTPRSASTRRVTSDEEKSPEESRPKPRYYNEPTNSEDEGSERSERSAPRRVTPPPAMARSAPPARNYTPSSSVDDEDNAPEEENDQVPPSPEPVDDTPEPVQAPRSAPTTSGLSKRLRDGIRGANDRP